MGEGVGEGVAVGGTGVAVGTRVAVGVADGGATVEVGKEVGVGALAGVTVTCGAHAGSARDRRIKAATLARFIAKVSRNGLKRR